MMDDDRLISRREMWIWGAVLFALVLSPLAINLLVHWYGTP
jgi:hypothetical protein